MYTSFLSPAVGGILGALDSFIIKRTFYRFIRA